VTALVKERVRAHATVLIERLIFWSRSLGLLPRVSGSDDPLGALCLDEDDVTAMLNGLREPRPDEDPLAERARRTRADLRALVDAAELGGVGLVELLRCFALADDALDGFVLALAPEWDLRFARLFGFLNNDLSRPRPTEAHLQILGAVVSPLVVVEASSLPAPARTVRVPEHVVAISSERVRATMPGPGGWDELHLAARDRDVLRTALAGALRRGRMVAIEGHPGSGRRAAGLAAAAAENRGHVDLDLGREDAKRRGPAIAAAILRARLSGAVAIVRSDGDVGDGLAELAREVEEQCVACVALVRPGELEGAGVRIRYTRLVMPRMRARERRRMWADAAAHCGVALADDDRDDVASRFELGPGRIVELAEELRARHGAAPIGVAEIGAALRALTAEKLGNLAQPYRGDASLDELVLGPDARERLHELVERLRQRYRVLEEWGLGADSGRGRGVTALFAGPSGTGKTAAAGAVARALDIDLHVIDLARVMSKWVGETEQNLARVFDEAEASGAALLFDEADSLFGKRSTDMKSASDRYANLTVNYLLQRMESHPGLAILTTNLESAIDGAFARRLCCRVEFTLPDADERVALWRELLPATVSYGPDVNLAVLAQRFPFPGARIRSVILRATYMAAARDPDGTRRIAQAELLRASALEFEDMGRVLQRSLAA
jgi:AAA+ superfamily predicted ATPase